ncbi:hypothetical protein [Streptomyces sp. NBC_01361]|uniref:hypothetical protein n=1 Tax=Streptomyces sp. NBC_01361 TaxID=2903838 RepID=UPI002E36B609|nr:hypothetical protein [Streptomyces sp. NBC_01361]
MNVYRNGIVVGWGEPNGTVWRGSRKGTGDQVGWADTNGKIWRGSQKGIGDQVGWVEPNGKIWSGRPGTGEQVGRLEPNGKIWRSDYGGEQVGSLDLIPDLQRAGAAALLLVLS